MSLENGAPPAQPSEEQELTALREAYLERLTRPGEPFRIADAFPRPADLDALHAQLSELKACLDSFRPLDPAQAQKLEEIFDTEYTFQLRVLDDGGNSSLSNPLLCETFIAPALPSAPIAMVTTTRPSSLRRRDADG